MAIDLKSLVGKLDEACRKTLEQAAGLTLSRTNFNVEIEHWLIKLLEVQDGDLAKILPRYQVDIGRITADLNRAPDEVRVIGKHVECHRSDCTTGKEFKHGVPLPEASSACSAAQTVKV